MSHVSSTQYSIAASSCKSLSNGKLPSNPNNELANENSILRQEVEDLKKAVQEFKIKEKNRDLATPNAKITSLEYSAQKEDKTPES